jgi:hypothetical protein
MEPRPADGGTATARPRAAARGRGRRLEAAPSAPEGYRSLRGMPAESRGRSLSDRRRRSPGGMARLAHAGAKRGERQPEGDALGRTAQLAHAQPHPALRGAPGRPGRGSPAPRRLRSRRHVSTPCSQPDRSRTHPRPDARGRPPGRSNLAQPVGVRAVAGPDHQHQVDLRPPCPAPPPGGSGWRSRCRPRRGPRCRETTHQRRDELAGVVEAERGLGHVGDPRMGLTLSGLQSSASMPATRCTSPSDRADRSLHFLGMATHDRSPSRRGRVAHSAAPASAPSPPAGRSHRPRAARATCACATTTSRGHAVRREHRHGAPRHRVHVLDEDRALLTKPVHDVAVVHDLVDHVDRAAVDLERTLDDLDRPDHAGAKPLGCASSASMGSSAAATGPPLWSPRPPAPARRRPPVCRVSAAAPATASRTPGSP